MDEIQKSIKEISDWADLEGRSSFVIVGRTDEGKQCVSVNSSPKGLAIMLAGAMCNDSVVARSVLRATAIYSANLCPSTPKASASSFENTNFDQPSTDK